MSKTKNTTWRWCAKYIKLRDAIEDYPITHNLDLVHCRTCGKWLITKSKEAQAGHFIGRGLSGSSGVYFDERNLTIQCYQCNAFKQGNAPAYRAYMLYRYGQKVLDELAIKDKTNLYKARDLIGLKLYYEQEYKKLVQKFEKMRNGNRY